MMSSSPESPTSTAPGNTRRRLLIGFPYREPYLSRYGTMAVSAIRESGWDPTMPLDDVPRGLLLENHETVRDSVGEYVRGQAHTNGIESFWSTLKRGYYGTYHRMSLKHLDRYAAEFPAGRTSGHSTRSTRWPASGAGLAGKRLRYRELTA